MGREEGVVMPNIFEKAGLVTIVVVIVFAILLAIFGKNEEPKVVKYECTTVDKVMTCKEIE